MKQEKGTKKGGMKERHERKKEKGEKETERDVWPEGVEGEAKEEEADE